MRVLIVDDHAIVREGLKQIVASDPAIIVADEAATGNEALIKIRDGGFDVLVLDLSLPDRSGFDVLAHARSALPPPAVLVLSMEREEEFAMRALRGGALGYLEKRGVPEQLIVAIKRVACGKRYFSAEMVERLVLELDHEGSDRPHDLLSQREFEIFLAIAGGKPVSQIAADLGVSVKTVNNHRARILLKMGMKSTTELIRYAIRYQLIR